MALLPAGGGALAARHCFAKPILHVSQQGFQTFVRQLANKDIHEAARWRSRRDVRRCDVERPLVRPASKCRREVVTALHPMDKTATKAHP